MAFVNTIEKYGDEATMDMIIERTIDEYCDDFVTKIGEFTFNHCIALTKVYIPNATSIGKEAFYGCTALTEVDVPNVTEIGQSAFYNCKVLTAAILPNVTSLSQAVFHNCYALAEATLPMCESIPSNVFISTAITKLDLPCVKSISSQAFAYSKIGSLLIRNTESICSLGNNNALSGTPIASGTGYIYVPRALVDSYKAATNWSTYAAQFRALEDYTVDGTVTGKFSAGTITYNLTGFGSSNAETFIVGSYQTTLTAYGDNASVNITMDGIDVTSEVYNAETGEVNIPKVAGDVIITASSDVESLQIPTWYSLPEPTTFNGSSDYIDTGIKLFDTAKNFTIIVDATFDRLASEKCLFHCMTEASKYPGLCIDGNSGVRIVYTGSNSLTTSITPASNVSTLALRYTAGKLDRIRYKNVAGQIVSHSIAGTPTYTAISQTLLLGAYQQTNGTKGRFFNGTINDFRLYDAALDDDTIDILLTVI